MHSGQTKTLTFGPDVITGTARNDVITAAKNTFTAIDLIADNSTTDSDTLNLTYDATDVANNAKVGVINIENVNINFDTIGTGVYDAGSTFGATITASSNRATFAGNVTVNNAAANNVVAGTGVTGTVTVDALTTGYVDAGGATTVALTNALNAATSIGYDVRVNGNVTINPETTGATANRSLALSATTDATVTVGTITGGVGATTLTQVLGAGKGKITLVAASTELSATPLVKGIDTLNLDGLGGLDLTNVGSTVKVTSALAQSYANVSGQSITSTGAFATTLDAKTANVSTGTITFTKTASTLTAGTDAFAALTVNLGKDVASFTGPVSLADAMTINVAAGKTTILAQTLGAGQTLTLAGAGDVTYAAITTNATTANSIDASGLSGGLTADVGANKITVTGGAGNDSITSSAATTDPTITTGAGADTVKFTTAFTSGSPTVTTGDGSDTVDFDDVSGTITGKITVSTGAGDDTIKWGTTTAGATGAATTLIIDGGDGTDTLALKTGDDLAFTTALTTGAITISNVEVLDLSAAAATVKFSNALLSGASYSIKGSSAADDIQVKVLASTTSTDLSKLTPDAAVEKFTVSAAAALNAYAFTGSSIADVVTASANGDTISGGGGKDTITGGAGADSIDGGAGSDSIVGSAGNDTVLGGTGNDTITILATLTANGTDTITTGAGADTVDATLVTTAGATALTTGQTLFAVTDFTAGTGGDVLKVSKATLGLTNYTVDDTNVFISKALLSALLTNADNSAGANDNYILFDSAQNINATNVKANLVAGAGGGMLAVASDTGNVYFDADGDFTSGAKIIGTLTITGTLVSDNINIAT